jgi:hypothetical protein
MLFDAFKGKKTYLVSLVSVVFGIVGLAFGWLDGEKAFGFITGGLGIAALRNGMSETTVPNDSKLPTPSTSEE